MLTISDLGKTFGDRTLFSGASLQINRGERVGLVGPNGAGKTTLFSIILGQAEADTGQVELIRGASLGYLPQESAPVGEETVLEVAMAIQPELSRAQQSLRKHPDPASPDHQEALARYHELGGPALEPKARKLLSQLAFRQADIAQPACRLSGGWIMRAHLARLLLMEPDLLMLDEPTNHLDLETLGWFQEHLSRYCGAILTISHDRAFLNGICDHIVEITHRKLHNYTGNFDSYLEQRIARREQQQAAYANQQREIASIETFISRFRAKNTKATQVQSRIKYLEKLERIEKPETPEATVHFQFPQPERSGQRVAMLEKVHQAYGDHVVYRDLSLVLERGQRTVLVGPNGSGKSTLLKILSGLVEIQGGSRELGLKVTHGYFSQQRTEVLDPSRTVLDEAREGARGVNEQEARTILGGFLFTGDDVFKRVGLLSGGEKSRLALVKLLLSPPNLLLLDEPTTHLDMASIDALLTALKGYTGTLVFVSHDVHFIREIADQVLHINAGALTRYPGDYDYYLFKSRASGEREALISGGGLSNAQPNRQAAATAGTASLNNKSKRKNAAEERRRRAELRKQVTELEAEVERLEARQQELTEALADPRTYSDAEQARRLNEEASEVLSAIEGATSKWEEASEALEALTDS